MFQLTKEEFIKTIIKEHKELYVMRCIFCKEDSTNSISREHIIPESLGGHSAVLPKGVVCDSCNNYFASKIELNVLASEEFTRLRSNQMIKSKKGRMPEIEIILNGDLVKARFIDKRNILFNEDKSLIIKTLLKYKKSGFMIIPTTGTPPSEKYMPRFLAKMALEALAMRLVNSDGGIVDHQQLDPIRNYARYAKTGEVWEYSKRRIYEEDIPQKGTDGILYQVMNEWDILMIGDIDHGEFYFVVAIFGMEYSINLGGNDMEGYGGWLKKNNNVSPLYYGKNTIQ